MPPTHAPWWCISNDWEIETRTGGATTFHGTGEARFAADSERRARGLESRDPLGRPGRLWMELALDWLDSYAASSLSDQRWQVAYFHVMWFHTSRTVLGLTLYMRATTELFPLNIVSEKRESRDLPPVNAAFCL